MIKESLKQVRAAAQTLRQVTFDQKNAVLLVLAKNIQTRKSEILAANQLDVKSLPAGSTAAFQDRLTLNDDRVSQMVEGLKQVALLADPVGEITESKTLQNGIKAERIRSPLGVIFMIFESRPNVAIEAFSLAFKSGNALILRGGKESHHTTSLLYLIITEALVSQGLPAMALWGVTDPDRALVQSLLSEDRMIDVVVPRGGEGLISFVTSNTKIPIIKNDRGMCHVYVHSDADREMAMNIVENAKCSRPGVCNAMETLLIHQDTAPHVLPELYTRLGRYGMQWFGCDRTRMLLSPSMPVTAATSESFDTEYLDYKINCRVVDSFEQAVEHIEVHGSRHSEAIVTSNAILAMRFQQEVDAAAVYWNASTRFTDGFELGLGGELGISTQKLHVRGPVGLKELTSVRWVLSGTGQIRK